MHHRSRRSLRAAVERSGPRVEAIYVPLVLVMPPAVETPVRDLSRTEHDPAFYLDLPARP